MTAEELRHKFDDEFGLFTWPATYEVDAETYANVCQEVFNNKVETQTIIRKSNNVFFINVSIGFKNGIVFKGVELILKHE